MRKRERMKDVMRTGVMIICVETINRKFFAKYKVRKA